LSDDDNDDDDDDDITLFGPSDDLYQRTQRLGYESQTLHHESLLNEFRYLLKFTY